MSVKEAVLPFDRFPGVDTLLGPEMRSTGEVMGIGSTFGLAFAKSQIAAGTRLPSEGAVFLSLADRDKAGGLEAARTFSELGFELLATSGTAAFLESNGVPVATVVAKVGESGRLRRRGPHRVGPRPTGGEHAPRPRTSRRRCAHPGRRPGPSGALPDHGGRGTRRGHGYRRLATARAVGGVPPGGARMRMAVDLRTYVGSVPLPNPVLTASGTAGHGAELGLLRRPRHARRRRGEVLVGRCRGPGIRRPRVHETPAGMLNSVGLQGPGVAAWLAHELPALNDRGARVVASIWGRSAEEYATGGRHARRRARCHRRGSECQLSRTSKTAVACSPTPHTPPRRRSPPQRRMRTPLWVKLSPNMPDIVEIAGAALDGRRRDPGAREHRPGHGHRREDAAPTVSARRQRGGGLSGPAIRPVAVRAVHDCRVAFPHVGIVGVGGVARGVDAWR